MNFAMLIKVIQFLKMIGPLVPELYAAVKAALPNSTGLVKFDAFVNQLRGYVAQVEELKPFVPVLEEAIPHLKVLVTDYHKDLKAATAAAPTAG